MRAAVKMLLLSLAVFVAALAIRLALFWDVKPIAWSDERPREGALEMAFLLLSIENMAAIVATIALIFLSVLWIERRRVAHPARLSSKARRHNRTSGVLPR